MEVRISEACAATGYCTRIAPEVFVLDEAAMRAVVRTNGLATPTASLREAVVEAEAVCPLGAIEVSTGHH